MAAILDETDQFEVIYKKPTIEEMHALAPKAFERFVAYVLERAGYGVTDTSFRFIQGVDLELHADARDEGPLVGGVEIKRFGAENYVSLADVQHLAGALALRRGRAPGYFITLSDFARTAYEFAARDGRVHLINGERFVRYITYVRGSSDRHTKAARGTLPPEAILKADGVLKSAHRSATKILAIANNKGGVGKTTTARYMALKFAERGQRVLLIDLDPQANLTAFVLKLDPRTQVEPPHLGDYFAGQWPLSHLVRPSATHERVFLAPAHPDLIRFDTGGFGKPLTEVQFVEDVYKTFASEPFGPHGPFDWVMIDTPPAVSLFTRAALAVADYVIAPVRARDSSYNGTANMLAAMDTMAALTGRAPELLGAVVTHWGEDETSEDAARVIATLFLTRGSRMLQSSIPNAVAIEARPHLAFRAMRAYDELAEEVMSLCRQH